MKNYIEDFINKSKLKREHGNLYSNYEIFSSLCVCDNKSYITDENSNFGPKRTSGECLMASGVNDENYINQKLHERFFLCLKQNGFKYTIRRLCIYFLHRNCTEEDCLGHKQA